MSKIDIIFETVKKFCNLILDVEKKDSIFSGLTEEEVRFCSIENEVILTVQDDFFKHIEIFNAVIDECCAAYEKEVLTNNDTPYKFYSSFSMNEHIEAFKSEFQKNGIKFPLYLEYIIRRITIKCINFENTSWHIDNRIRTASSRNLADIEQKVTDVKEEAKEFKKDMVDWLETITTMYDSVQDKMAKSEKKSMENSITILGIFSAIVLVANAGISISTDVLQNLITADISRAALIFSVFGVILGNIVLGLISYLEHVRTGEETKSESYLEKVRTPVCCLNIILGFVAILLTISLFVGSINKPEEIITTNESSEVYQISGDIICKTN